MPPADGVFPCRCGGIPCPGGGNHRGGSPCVRPCAWASPAERTILNFAEGDVTRTVCDTDEAFTSALREIDRWNRDHGYGPARIDPGFDPALNAAI